MPLERSLFPFYNKVPANRNYPCMNTEQNKREAVTNEDLAEMIKSHFVKLENKIDALAERVGELEGKVSGLEGKVSGLEGKVSGLEGKSDSIEKRIDRLETTIKDHFNLIEKKWEIRMQINEDRLQIVKNVIVHDLATKVPW